MKKITSIGYTESNLLMISEILLSHSLYPKIYVFDNQKRYNDFKIEHELEIVYSLEKLENFVFCLTKPKGKFFFINEMKLDKNKFINLIHMSSELSKYTTIGFGLRVEPFTYIGPKSIIGDFVNINRGCMIGHHNEINDFSTLNPAVKTAGNVKIGKNCEIGIGSTILDNIRIGNNTIIGAGSVVTKDVPDNVIAYGVPCKIIKENK